MVIAIRGVLPLINTTFSVVADNACKIREFDRVLRIEDFDAD